MKKILSFALTALLLFSLAACSSGQKNPAQDSGETNSQQQIESAAADNGILVAYFSRTGENYNVGNIEKGNTSVVADIITEKTGADLFEIVPVNPYPDNYEECVEKANREKDENARPQISSSVENMDSYNTVFIGYPIWCGDMPMVVYTFLESYDFSGKTVIPFSTNEGSGLADTVQSISEICAGAKVLDGFSIQGETAQNNRTETEQGVTEWLEKIGVAP